MATAVAVGSFSFAPPLFYNHDYLTTSGDYTISLGGAQPNDAASVQTGKFTIAGRAELPK